MKPQNHTAEYMRMIARQLFLEISPRTPLDARPCRDLETARFERRRLMLEEMRNQARQGL